MKRFNLIYLLLIGALLLTSCSSSYLDAEDSENAAGDDVMNHPESASILMRGVYMELYSPADMESHDTFGLKAIDLATDLMADDVILYDQNTFFITDYKHDNRADNKRRTKYTWSQLNTVNASLGTILNILKEKDPNDEKNISLRGQALALRAYVNFKLVNLYQQPYFVDKTAPGIPIFREEEDDFHVGSRAPVEEVYKYILQDIDEACKILEGLGGGITQINEFSAAAIRARILCFVNDYPNQWAEVAKSADKATKGAKLAGKEELLSGFNTVTTSDVLWGVLISSETNTYYASWMSHLDPTSIGYANGGPKSISSDLYSKMDTTDVRKEWFIGKDTTLVGKDRMPPYTSLKYKDRGSFTSDYIYIRASEMYFVKAEALYLNGDEAGAKTALTTVMSTRVAGYSTTKTGDDLLEEIRNQKRIETWGEGCRLFDMKWRGEALDRFNSTNHSPGVIGKLPANAEEFIYSIPRTELDANLEISSADQNPLAPKRDDKWYISPK